MPTGRREGSTMNHPRIDTKNLSDECIKAIADALITDFYRQCDAAQYIEFPSVPGAATIAAEHRDAALREYKKIERFLDR
jgi:hypothetical protein